MARTCHRYGRQFYAAYRTVPVIHHFNLSLSLFKGNPPKRSAEQQHEKRQHVDLEQQPPPQVQLSLNTRRRSRCTVLPRKQGRRQRQILQTILRSSRSPVPAHTHLLPRQRPRRPDVLALRPRPLLLRNGMQTKPSWMLNGSL